MFKGHVSTHMSYRQSYSFFFNPRPFLYGHIWFTQLHYLLITLQQSPSLSRCPFLPRFGLSSLTFKLSFLLCSAVCEICSGSAYAMGNGVASGLNNQSLTRSMADCKTTLEHVHARALLVFSVCLVVLPCWAAELHHSHSLTPPPQSKKGKKI